MQETGVESTAAPRGSGEGQAKRKPRTHAVVHAVLEFKLHSTTGAGSCGVLYARGITVRDYSP